MIELIAIILAVLFGIWIGVLTGLAPGIHINLVSIGIVAASGFILNVLGIPIIAIVVFIVSLSITHTFVDFIPSIFLGAPDEDDNALAILPGHEMLIKGKAYEAIFLTLLGSLAGIFLILIFTPIFIHYLPIIYEYTKRIMPLILLVASLFLIFMEKSSKIWAFIIFLLSGFLGLASYNLPIKQSLLPLFTGLFGVSSLITSIAKKQKLPEQKVIAIKNMLPKRKSFLKAVFASFLSSPLCSFLPGMGSGQAAVIGSQVSGDLNRKEFLILLGSINTLVTGLSFITLFSINKARTGVAAAVQSLMQLTTQDIWIILGVIIISGILSFFITLFIARIFSRIINKIDYTKLSASIIILLIILVLIFSGLLGFLLMIISTSLGLCCIYAGVRRTHLMGCLIIPAILFNL
jgi:putative membrane protein